MIRALALCLALAAPAAAQQANSAPGGVLRVLDKQTGHVEDLELQAGQTAQSGLVEVSLGACRYPAGNPAGDAYALLTVHYRGQVEPVFRGWMIASAPALNAMDHPRYDVWVLRCITS
ncbi:hypothetical protein OG2516_01791 [Oceanicola granulosus HTCC2516]|uniref:DUF2155 domain-containing protein n=1 Tax=Oceanicola granulosus (strain ATCC BAA-861 / DSM 15982 / KCTC 12143 / HTCC2516) TaxID=314256 RepID=Q2CFT1_OCEGH|nr:DUF2155 domain-containing protein [Oceanicola granulosus]EAR51611.1 hypothetical protein OG2516_01791 [Oceanicola granulosus HTCC2516]